MKNIIKGLIFTVAVFSGASRAAIIDFNSLTIKAHNSQNKGSYTVEDGGSTLILAENSWFGIKVSDAFDLSSLNLQDPDTSYVLNFDFRFIGLENGGRSEIAGLYFGDFSRKVVDQVSDRTVVFSGTQKPGDPYGIRDFDYNFSSSDWMNFSLTLDDLLTGKVTDIIFLNDCDEDCNDLNVGFRNLSLSSEVNEPTAVTLALLGLGFIGWRARRQKTA